MHRTHRPKPLRETVGQRHLRSFRQGQLDPGYEFTTQYGLRWDAPHETAYPSTFLIDRQGMVFFSKIVKEHGGRTSAAEIVQALPKPKAGR